VLKEDIINTLKLNCIDLSFPEIDWKNFIDRKFFNIKKPSFFIKVIDKFIFRREPDYYSIVLQNIIKIRKKAKNFFNIKPSDEKIKFLLRVDDFPREGVLSERFYEFHDILNEYKIPYLLGVTPKPYGRNLTDSELKILKDVSKDKVEFALHGFTHKTRNKKIKSELIGMAEEELLEKIKTGLEFLNDFNIKIFIPPFNTIDYKSYQIVSSKFQCICGGKETIKYLGFLPTPCFLMGKIYIPSYYPVYARSEEILRYIKETLNKIEENIFVPLTLHWTWETKNNFASLKELAKEISDRVIPWGDFINTAEKCKV